MTKLERLLRGDKATFRNFPIIDCRDYSHVKNIDNDYRIMLVVVTEGGVDHFWWSNSDINNTNEIKFL